jgi:subtilisin
MRKMIFGKSLYLGLILTAITACKKENTTQAEPEPIKEDCLVRTAANHGEIIDGDYIISFKPSTSINSLTTLQAEQREAAFLAEYAISRTDIQQYIHGSVECAIVHIEQESTLNALQQDPSVLSIEPDRIVGICNACLAIAEPRRITWNVQKTGYGGLNNDKRTAWIIDTGVDLDHPDLNVDQARSRSFITGQTTAEDENGHGTHVAGVIAAKNNTVGLLGVVPDAQIVALKVLDQIGEGRLSNIIAAVAHVRQNGKSGDVVNMSLGGEFASLRLDQEISAAANMGILFAIAAGNESEDANNYSPARYNHPNVFTVSAVDSLDRFASFSNFGTSVDVAAYGVRIPSTYSNGRYAILSGTSMAAPHVAGLLLVRGRNIPKRGAAINDPDGVADPIARE